MIGIYVRVSTVGQNEAGQKREIRRWLKGNGISEADARWFVDKGESREKLDRPAFNKLQAAVFAGEVKTIVVWKLDRLAGSIRDGINTLADWCDRGLRVVSVTQQLDFNGTVGKMIAAMLFGISEMEMETRRERQRAGIEAARETGVYRGRRRGATKGGGKRNLPRRAVELRQKGLNDSEIATALGVSRRTVQRYVNQRKGR